jgi:eukaryotic-like serine/threonine-protein kinase
VASFSAPAVSPALANQRNWLPTIRAAIALERKDPNRAIELLKDTGAIELGQPTNSLAIFLCPVYVGGEAYLMLHDGKASAAEFQKFIDHRGVVVNFPWGAMAEHSTASRHKLQYSGTRVVWLWPTVLFR